MISFLAKPGIMGTGRYETSICGRNSDDIFIVKSGPF